MQRNNARVGFISQGTKLIGSRVPYDHKGIQRNKSPVDMKPCPALLKKRLKSISDHKISQTTK